MIQDDGNKKRILVVEDEPVISLVCRRTLTAEGFEVDTASNGIVAKEMVNKKEYDLCLIDIRTPEMNGMQLYHYFGEEHPELTSRAIFTTGDVLDGNVKAFLMDVNQSCLPKPFTPGELRAVVREALSR